jgi:hypothetical protein
MKITKFIIVLACLWATFTTNAQNCADPFYISKEGSVLNYEHYDSKNKLSSSQETTLKSIDTTPNGYALIMSTTMKDAKGKMLFDNRNFNVQCENGVIKMDLSSMYMGDIKDMGKDIKMEISGEGISYPAELKEGLDLPNGETEVKMKSGSMTLVTMRFNELNRKVEKVETVTTPAGTFNCYKIVAETEMKILFKCNFKSATWIAKGVGVVKTESYNKKGELEGSMLLTKLVK